MALLSPPPAPRCFIGVDPLARFSPHHLSHHPELLSLHSETRPDEHRSASALLLPPIPVSPPSPPPLCSPPPPPPPLLSLPLPHTHFDDVGSLAPSPSQFPGGGQSTPTPPPMTGTTAATNGSNVNAGPLNTTPSSNSNSSGARAQLKMSAAAKGADGARKQAASPVDGAQK